VLLANADQIIFCEVRIAPGRGNRTVSRKLPHHTDAPFRKSNVATLWPTICGVTRLNSFTFASDAPVIGEKLALRRDQHHPMILMFADWAIANTLTNPGPESMSIGPDVTVRVPGAQRSSKSMYASPVPPSRGCQQRPWSAGKLAYR
jgi:hypothetical protein